MNRITIFIVLLFSFLSSFYAHSQIDEAAIEQFVYDFSGAYGISDDQVREILSKAEYQPSIIEKITKPAEGMPWHRYRNIFMKEDRINAGLDFWKENAGILADVSEKTGVSEEAIIGILGVETFFGQRKGSYRVLDALYTLSFAYPKRSKFFRSELEEFIVLCHKEKLDVYTIKGSYAGAIGYGQFMPSSYRAYAVSYDEGGSRDLTNDIGDGIASVANYLKVHKWRQGEPVAIKALTSEKTVALKKQSTKPKYKTAYYINQGYTPSKQVDVTTLSTLLEFEEEEGQSFWFGFNNFYTITRYNHSPLYALVVYQLGEEIKQRRSASSN